MRFKSVTENINCNYDTKAGPRGKADHNHHHKLQQVINALNSHLKEEYTPSRVVAVDKSLVQLKG
jgi:hypothetical protein